MQDKLVIETDDDRVYAIALDDLAQYEVADDDAKADIAAAKGETVDEDDEVSGFARRPRVGGMSARIFIIRR